MGRPKTHGDTGAVEYAAWQRMKYRCSSGHPYRSAYFDRGITVCEEWTGEGGYERFLAHVGRRPSPKHTLDRIDNDRGYEPGNVRWATRSEQQRNRRTVHLLTIDGVTKCIAEWVEESPASDVTVRARLRKGWLPKRAVFTPVRRD